MLPKSKLILLIFPLFLFAQKPKLLLLKTYKEQNITGWVMSEKLDGIRAYWDGKNLRSRAGNIMNAPKYFTQNYPPFEIDGELWTKRGDFENISSIVRTKNPSPKWKELKHYIFEVPNSQGNLAQRLAKLKPYSSEIIQIIPQIPIRDTKHLKRFLKEIEAKNGEGVVVRNPNTPYINHRSSQALKVKSFKDTECEVIGYKKGKGRLKGVVGSLICKLKNNIEFRVGSGLSDALRASPPKIGTIITIKYQNLTKYGKPRFPVFLRVRE